MNRSAASLTFILASIVLYSLLVSVSAVYAASITVDKSSDEDPNGTCTLADAITAANTDTATNGCTAGSGADTITLGVNITLADWLPDITSEITIEGANYDIDGNGEYQIFYVDGGDLTINNITLTGGDAGNYGGAIDTVGGSLTVTNSRLEDNEAGLLGGAIATDNTNVIIRNSVFVGNTSGSLGGALAFFSNVPTDIGWTDDMEVKTLLIYQTTFGEDVPVGCAAADISADPENKAEASGGAIRISGGDATIRRSSFIGNKAGVDGGAIYASAWRFLFENNTVSCNRADADGGGMYIIVGDLILRHSTIYQNSAGDQGGGIFTIDDTGRDMDNDEEGLGLYLQNTIIAGSTGGGDCVAHDTIDHNIGMYVGDGSCEPTCSSTDGPINLGELQGEPAYHPILDGSIAINRADQDVCSLADTSEDTVESQQVQDFTGMDICDELEPLQDQIGTNRPMYGACDIGAIESRTGVEYETIADTDPPSPTPSPTPSPIPTSTVDVQATENSVKQTEDARATDAAATQTSVKQTEDARATDAAAAQTSVKQTEDARATDAVAVQTSVKQTEDARATDAAAAQTSVKQTEDARATDAVAVQTSVKQTEDARATDAAAVQTLVKQTEDARATDAAAAQTSVKQTQDAGATETEKAHETETEVAKLPPADQTATADADATETSEAAQTQTEAAGQTETAEATRTSSPSPSLSPSPSPSPDPDTACRHTVAAGETLFQIANIYGTTVEKFRQLNQLSNDTLFVGQELIVPDCYNPGDDAVSSSLDYTCQQLFDSMVVRTTSRVVSCRAVDINFIDKHPALASGMIAAVDLLGYVDSGVEVCFRSIGDLVFVDATIEPPTPRSMESYDNEMGMTCGEVNHIGTIVLVTSITELGTYLELSSCSVATTQVLRLRDEVGSSAVLGLVPYNVTLATEARTNNWFKVTFLGMEGWISASYVHTNGICQ